MDRLDRWIMGPCFGRIFNQQNIVGSGTHFFSEDSISKTSKNHCGLSTLAETLSYLSFRTIFWSVIWGGVTNFFQTILWNISAVASKDLFVRVKSIFPSILPLLSTSPNQLEPKCHICMFTWVCFCKLFTDQNHHYIE